VIQRIQFTTDKDAEDKSTNKEMLHTSGARTATLPEHLSLPADVNTVRVALVFYVVCYRSLFVLFVLFLLVIVLSVLLLLAILRFTDSDDSFGIFKLFTKTKINPITSTALTHVNSD